MAIYRYEDKEPVIGSECFVADSAQIIGHVEIGDGCYIGHNAVLRGDYGGMRIGDGSAIEECAVLHVPPETIMELGERVTVGHGAVVPTNTKIPAEKLLVGVPARIHSDVTVENRKFWSFGKQLYRDLARDLPSKLVRLD